mgnify:FL=1
MSINGSILYDNASLNSAALPSVGDIEVIGEADTNWTQEGTFSAVSAALARFDDIDGYIYDYADGFRGAVRAYESTNTPLDIVVALRTDEQGLFCDWEKAGNENFKIYYSSGQNFQARIALTAAMMAEAGEELPPRLEVPFSMKLGGEGLPAPPLWPQGAGFGLLANRGVAGDGALDQGQLAAAEAGALAGGVVAVQAAGLPGIHGDGPVAQVAAQGLAELGVGD